MSPKALEQRAFGRFRVDLRACNGRKGFPHIGTDELDQGEREQIRARLLGTIQAAVNEGLLVSGDLEMLSGCVRSQIVLPLFVGESIGTQAGESIGTQAGESIRARAREEI